MPNWETRTLSILSEVEDERLHQVLDEGWTPEHDDSHPPGVLATAGAVYALHAGMSDANRDVYTRPGSRPPIQWPFADEWWKPSDRRRELIKAAALIVAEIEKMDRAAS